jgi:hypothetical protein
MGHLLRSWPTAGLDVLVNVERVAGVIAVLDAGEPVVVAAIGGLDPFASFVHEEVDVAAAGRGRVQGLPVVAGPVRDDACVSGILVDAGRQLLAVLDVGAG